LAKHSFWDATWRVDGNVEWPAAPKGLDLLSGLAYFSTGVEQNRSINGLKVSLFTKCCGKILRPGRFIYGCFLQTDSERVGMYYQRWPSWLEPVGSVLLRLERRLPWWLRWSKPPYSLPRRFFPHQYVIVDAALTNCQGCWMARYLYI